MYICSTVVLLFAVWHSSTTATEVKARCTGNLDLYADGVLKGSHNSGTTTKTFSLSDSTEIVAMKCNSTGTTSTRAGIFASFNTEIDGDYQTDNTWRCSDKKTADWYSKSFNDSLWGYAETSGTNAATANGLTRISSIQSFVKWIWTALYTVETGHKTVYCRGYPKVPATYDSYSRRFVVGFMENNKGSPRKDIKLMFTTLTPTDVTVRVTTPRLTTSNSLFVDDSLTVKAGEVKTVILPRDLRHYTTSIQDYGILALASQPVKIIGLNQEQYSTDMVLMLPITSLGSSTTANIYYTVNWDDSSDARVLLVAGYDNTVITVRSPKLFYYASSSRSANTDLTITLTHKYKSVQLTASGGFTGTKITSTKPLVVYTGNKKAKVSNDASGTSSDHLVEQLTPTRNWGKKFYVTPLPYSSTGTEARMGKQLSKYKYVAAEASTSVTIKNYNTDGTTYGSPIIFSLNAGAYKDITHKRGKYAIVTSNKGIQVAQFATTMTSSSSTYGTSGNCMGDPWLQIIPPSEAFSRDYGLLTPALVDSTSCPAQHFVTITVHKNEKTGITINNEALDWSSGVNIATTDYVYITVNIPYHLTNGIRVQHSKTYVSFGVYFFGYGRMDSYATMGGSRMAPINEACQNIASQLGDGLDNNCNGEIDEDDCGNVNDPVRDCAPPPPVNGNWGAWSDQGLCVCPSGSTTGEQSRVRTCSNPVPMYNGWPCNTTIEGSLKEVPCQCIPVAGNWSVWSNWGSCSTTCGPGSKTRSRTCTNPKPLYGGATCSGGSSESATCTVKHCPVNGGWSTWSTSGSCVCPSGTADGKQQYVRTCSNPAANYGGADCDNSTHGTNKEENCNCPLDGKWSAWSAYDTCSATCGPGTYSRSRTCTNPSPVYGGANCSGSSTETANCMIIHCPVHGGWTNWNITGSCVCPTGSADGKQDYIRDCTNPTPIHGGNYCDTSQHNTTKQEDCNCPLDGKWSAWSAYGTCSATCGPGTYSRSRTCTNPSPVYGGANCSGSSTETANCMIIHCPVHGGWTNWNITGSCVCPTGSVDGKQDYIRDCTNPTPIHGGNYCDTSQHNTTKQEDCNCPLDGGWSVWSAYDNCTAPCGQGTKFRSRTCTNPTPVYGGADCTGNENETASCQIKFCPIDGDWSDWSAPGNCVCPADSTDGQAQYTRTCTNPAPQYGGVTCSTIVQGETKSEACNCVLATTDASLGIGGVAHQNQNQNQGQQPASSAAAIGGAIGGLAALAAGGGLMYAIIRKKLKKEKEKELDDSDNFDSDGMGGSGESAMNGSSPMNTGMPTINV